MANLTSQKGAGTCSDELKPWHEPVDIGVELQRAVDLIRRYIILEPFEAEASALWAFHSYVIDSASVSPILLINAPERSCAKTLLQELLGMLVLRPLSAANSSTAAIFRSLEATRPTLMIDEADMFLKERPELQGILNAGYRKNGFVLRTEASGDSYETRSYHVYGAKCLAGIALEKHLKDALMSRCIEIRMRRKLPGEAVERFRNLDQVLLAELRSKFLRFAEDQQEKLATVVPPLPEQLGDRAQDNWEPLLAIAVCAGGDWLARATGASIAISGKKASEGGAGNELLSDIREVLGSDRKVRTIDLLKRLMDEELGWSTYNRGKPLTPRQLSKLLEPYGIRPKTVRMGPLETPKGYESADFEDAFRRYLPDYVAPPILELSLDDDKGVY
jgi:putative DNA primase/helicase